ncbi:hypothetical protein ScPMuIL_012044 [Solemya velum]
MSSSEIPVIDFAIYGLNNANTSSANQDEVKCLAASINAALENIGFCYLKNHGVPETLLKEYRETSREFFLLPDEMKEKYKRFRVPEEYTGWLGLEKEALNPKRPGDLREVFDYTPYGNLDGCPEDLCPDFLRTCDQFFKTVQDLAMRVLEVVAVGLQLPEEVARGVLDCHKLVGQKGNYTEIRTSYYPPIGDRALKPDQIRLGEHSDFGSLSLLFQDDAGGLEVCTRTGDYIPATPIPGTAVLKVGQILQRWTADRLVATKHRILIPDDRRFHERQSVVMFLCPDDDASIQCLDGSNKYPPTPFLEHLFKMMKELYAAK